VTIYNRAMRSTLLAAGLAIAMLTSTSAQEPGDRPAPNPDSTRSVVLARHGLVATSQPLASAAGLQVLMEGGNAIDAAVTAAAVLSVVEPTMNGIGGDLFAIVRDAKTGTITGLNASGRSGYAATPAEFARRTLTRIPYRGPLSVSVPGVVDGWARLLERYGTISLARGHAPATGQVFSNPRLAASLEQIASEGPGAFYRGAIAKAIVDDLQRRGGLLTMRDFAEHESDWVEPLSTTYRGYQVLELPPNTQGVTALEMLNILEGFDLKALGHNTAPYLHRLVEAKRIAFADRDAYVADPGFVPPAALAMMLSKDYAAARRKEIAMDRAAAEYAPGKPGGGTAQVAPAPASGRWPPPMGDTVYLTAADGQGNAISLIESLFETFGAGIVAGDTGIALQNRGTLFTLEDGHPNQIAPHKRPFHTLVPAMVLKDGKPWLSFGVMGGDMQPQGHVQVLLNLIDFGMNVQEAGEAARFRDLASGVALESAISPEARFGLAERGHRLVDVIGGFGGFQGILIDPRTGVLMGGSDPRKDGLAIGY
jgi:gamma-glutamyltranspeptidase/glutathione hydrolase